MTGPRTVWGCAEQFAARGDEWNNPNYQHDASVKGWRTRWHPDGTLERIFHDDVTGYDHARNRSPYHAMPKKDFVETHVGNPASVAEARLKFNEKRKVEKMLANLKLKV